ncbi:hypothetical protein ASO20_01670 [Mycoplasma sp. (ex Biomphalaria glabrata)]|uniref:fructose-bisphosphatase class II n=1 Tax=Mycoplasma sp. (ex Biomphalaria glabrata) TaxID=1749074 RepID=UPI00073AB15A|nr:fructose-bisphosphatase class II [Mycoplasma sp. (ex Biomphalaria glabrata)]ALV23356.1 hypothetical protein ASO20_01670 [Mycoplasma sp. (ex Biomphalaria glabrata)]
MNKDFQFIRITELAAISSYPIIGSHNKNLIDEYAVKKMRKLLNDTDAKIYVKVGEGTLDEAPMLYVDEVLGKKNSKYKFDIVVDPIEGTSNAAKNSGPSGCVIAISRWNKIKALPDMYMEKFFCKQMFAKSISLKKTLEQNVIGMQKIKQNLKCLILNKPRHKFAIEILKKMNVDVKTIDDGDILAAILVVSKDYDFIYGIGGAPEGSAMAALAISTFCHFEGRLYPYEKIWGKDEHSARESIIMNEKKLNYKKIYKSDDLIKDKKVRFITTFLTDLEHLKGIKKINDNYEVNTFFASHGVYRKIDSFYNTETIKQLKPNLFN